MPHKLDVSVPAARYAELVERAPAVVAEVDAGARTISYGHVGDGNVHVNILGPAPDDEAVDDAVLGLVLELGGSVSAEHGIGVAKVGWLERDRGSARSTRCARSRTPGIRPASSTPASCSRPIPDTDRQEWA